MSEDTGKDPSQLSLLELFRAEVETQTAILNTGLLELERAEDATHALQTLMRAAHSIKGAARIIHLTGAVNVAHQMEDCFEAAQRKDLSLGQREVDLLLRSTDLLGQLTRRSDAEIGQWETDASQEIRETLKALKTLATGQRPGGDRRGPDPRGHSPALSTGTAVDLPVPLRGSRGDPSERVVRLTAESLNRLLALAGESLVESRWLRPFADSLQRLKRRQSDIAQTLGDLRACLQDTGLNERVKDLLHQLAGQLSDSRQFLAEKMQDLDMYDRRSAHLSHRLYLEVLRTRMRPFSDGVRRFPRMVRDLARSLGKEVQLEITGETTQVDREILERLETPLAHLLRNAVDHGCETPTQRKESGKPAECTLRLDARHSAGMLVISVADDGRGVLVDEVRTAAVRRGFGQPDSIHRLSEPELLEFLFLPGFTLRNQVTEISGRGVGLDVVQNMVRSVRGGMRISNQPGRGFRVQIQLPLTLSVVRALLLEIGGEPYAIPLAQILRALRLPPTAIQSDNRGRWFRFGDQTLGLICGSRLFGRRPRSADQVDVPVVVLGERSTRMGLSVDRFLGERELVVHPLDPRLGHIENVASAALMEDGCPVLILEVEELLRSMGRHATGASGQWGVSEQTADQPRRILVVDDSPVVRELERKLLSRNGYLADVAADGAEAWKALESVAFDLVITDIDMPGMDGIELAARIKQSSRLRSIPVLIISYKDNERERERGLKAGADYYLSKGTFHDGVLLRTVAELLARERPAPLEATPA